MLVGLVDPTGYNDLRKGFTIEIKQAPPLGLAYVAASAKRSSEVVMIDVSTSTRRGIDDFLTLLMDIVGFSITSFSFFDALAMAIEVKKRPECGGYCGWATYV